MYPKQRRIIERHFRTLFSSKAFLRISTEEDFKSLQPFHPHLKINRRSIYLSEIAIASLNHISEIISKLPLISGRVNLSDVYSQAHKTYESFVQQDQTPNAETFINEIIDALKSQIKAYNFLVQISGLELEGIETLELGSFKIQRASKKFLDELDLEEIVVKDSIYREFEKGFWLIGTATGTESVALKIFDLHALLRIGILAIYSSIRFEGAFSKTRIGALINPQEGFCTTHNLRWEKSGENVSFSFSFGAKSSLTLSSEDCDYFKKQCFLKKICESLELEDKSEIQESIFRSVYWFADAYRDNTPIMRFVKLWTSAECFFAIGDEPITESNAMGIATLLIFSGYGIKKPEDYHPLKARIKKLYALRSKAVHHAEFNHINEKDINELSYWIAWTIISMTSLPSKGYKSLREVRGQILRLESSIKNQTTQI